MTRASDENGRHGLGLHRDGFLCPLLFGLGLMKSGERDTKLVANPCAVVPRQVTDTRLRASASLRDLHLREAPRSEV